MVEQLFGYVLKVHTDAFSNGQNEERLAQEILQREHPVTKTDWMLRADMLDEEGNPKLAADARHVANAIHRHWVMERFQ